MRKLAYRTAALLLLFLKIGNGEEQTCSASDFEEPDSALQNMTFDLGNGEETHLVYVQPDVSTFYQEKAGSRRLKKPWFKGMAGKFYNLSPKDLILYWDPMNGKEGYVIAQAHPFETVGTATFEGHVFYFTPRGQPTERLATFTIEYGKPHYEYDPMTESDYEALSEDYRERYDAQVATLNFNGEYKKFTGRDYLSLYPRKPPAHKMWRADHFGQEHWVATRETQFVSHPPEEDLKKSKVAGYTRKMAKDEPRILQDYRNTSSPLLNLTLKAISCAPRAFEIMNFLSEVEIDHILHLATGMTLSKSTTTGSVGDDTSYEADTGTRTSKNTWVYREKTAITDAIYRRAADLLRIDEALLRTRGATERPDVGTRKSVAEALQLVSYEIGQEYTAHHDWSYPRTDNKAQPSRFATILLYLNEDMKGGHTTFPRWANSKSADELHITPEKGKAVLFYSILPDGNMDDLSQHAAKPITDGKKWLMNLWVWDPIYEP